MKDDDDENNLVSLAKVASDISHLDMCIVDKIRTIETKLRDIVSVPLMITIDGSRRESGDPICFGFGKLNNAWVLHTQPFGALDDRVPLLESSRGLRIEMLGFIGELISESIPWLDKMAEDRRKAVREADRIIAALERAK